MTALGNKLCIFTEAKYVASDPPILVGPLKVLKKTLNSEQLLNIMLKCSNIANEC